MKTIIINGADHKISAPDERAILSIAASGGLGETAQCVEGSGRHKKCHINRRYLERWWKCWSVAKPPAIAGWFDAHRRHSACVYLTGEGVLVADALLTQPEAK